MAKIEKEVKELLKQAVDYVGGVQQELDRSRTAGSDFRKQAERTAGVLVDRGIVLRDKADEFVKKVAEDHSYALRMVERLAGMIEAAPEFGKSASHGETAVFASKNADPFEVAFAADLLGGRSYNQQL